MDLDHVVIWVEDPLRSLDFYVNIVGLTPVRDAEFRTGDAPFPSVRVSETSIIDLNPLSAASELDAVTKVDGSTGHAVNHLCISVTPDEYEAVNARLTAHGVDTSARLEHTYGARAWAPVAFYFRDPDDNVIEIRHY